MEEYRFYYDENGDYLGAIYDTDPIPSGWVTYTIIVPPSLLAGSGSVLEKWSFAKNNWYMPFTIQRLKDYRDQKIGVELSFDTGSAELNVVNNVESYSALSRICNGIPIENDPLGFVKWKNIDGEYHDANYADIQSLFFLCYRREQDCRNAEQLVLANNLITPYVDLADATDDFDTEIGE